MRTQYQAFEHQQPESRISQTKTAVSRTTFGRHESFQLRYGWLSKAAAALLDDPQVFSSEDATVKLGVGKNMVSSIRYWVQAAGVAEADGQLSPLGELLFGEKGFDRYLEDDGTLWLLHFQLAKNQSLATGIYWLFNHFHKADFSTAEVVMHLQAFAHDQGWKATEKALKKDLQTILRMYAPHKLKETQLEDRLESPLSLLGLLHYFEGRYHFVSSNKNNLPLGIMAYALSELMEDKKVMAVRDLMYGDDLALGSIFRLTEESLTALLENIAEQHPEYQLREDAGIFQIHKRKDVDSYDFLREYYG